MFYLELYDQAKDSNDQILQINPNDHSALNYKLMIEDNIDDSISEEISMPTIVEETKRIKVH